MAYHYYFPEIFIELNKEIGYHPELLSLLAKHTNGEFELILAEIAAYCKVEVDGEFTQEDLEKLAELCLKILHKKRTILLS